jgi:two-component system response regulator AtoC
MATASQLSRISPSVTTSRRLSNTPVRQVLAIGGEPAIQPYLQKLFAGDQLAVARLTKEQALIRLQKGILPDIILLQASGRFALETLTELRQARANIPIIVLSSFQDSQFIVKAMRMGASDCVQLPFDADLLRDSVRRFLERVGDGTNAETVFETPLSETTSFVCASARMNEIRGQCSILARVDLPVLILGESGTGKEIIAQYIHKMSPRAHRAFLKVNCAAMPADLLESELFGYEQGAFTGAIKAKPGKFEICNMGTIFLDEIGEMPPGLQSKLLQVLQDGTFSRLGGRSCAKVDVRVIAATNIDMNAAIAAKMFRQDLFYRLNGFSIQLPPLRERKEEIPVLIRYFMGKLSEKYSQQPLTMSQTLLQACMDHDWPGNLRELENCVKRFLVFGNEQHMLAELRSARGNPSAGTSPTNIDLEGVTGGLKKLARCAMDQAETKAMSEVLRRHQWNRKQAADELQISYKALLYKIRQYGLAPAPVSEIRIKAASGS